MRLLSCGGSEREYQKGDESAWYADGDKIVRNEYNPATAYAFGIILTIFFSLFMILIECIILGIV